PRRPARRSPAGQPRRTGPGSPRRPCPSPGQRTGRRARPPVTRARGRRAPPAGLCGTVHRRGCCARPQLARSFLPVVGTMSGYGARGIPLALSRSCFLRCGGPALTREELLSDQGVPVPRRLASVTLDNLDDLPHKCRKCVFWELDPVSHARAQEVGDPALEKEAWVSAMLLEWGSCGKIAYVDSVPAGYVLYAPPLYVPRSVAFPTSPVSGDAVLLMTANILAEFQGGGLGRMLVQGVAKDLTRRGVKAIEAFGDLRGDGISCMLPADYLLAVGFKTVRPRLPFPRLGLDVEMPAPLGTAVEGRVGVGGEGLLGWMTAERALRLG